jgi:hypothetical protein
MMERLKRGLASAVSRIPETGTHERRLHREEIPWLNPGNGVLEEKKQVRLGFAPVTPGGYIQLFDRHPISFGTSVLNDFLLSLAPSPEG